MTGFWVGFPYMSKQTPGSIESGPVPIEFLALTHASIGSPMFKP